MSIWKSKYTEIRRNIQKTGMTTLFILMLAHLFGQYLFNNKTDLFKGHPTKKKTIHVPQKNLTLAELQVED